MSHEQCLDFLPTNLISFMSFSVQDGIISFLFFFFFFFFSLIGGLDKIQEGWKMIVKKRRVMLTSC
jgi:hypothetical protein